jgi:hypothetical protein
VCGLQPISRPARTSFRLRVTGRSEPRREIPGKTPRHRESRMAE